MTFTKDFTLEEFFGMMKMAETDPGMADLLTQAKEYFILKGGQPSRLPVYETEEHKWQRILNTPYNI